MVKKDKIEKVEEIRTIFETSKSIMFTDHSGLKAENAFKIRNSLSEIDAILKIVKNTLALRAVAEVYKELDFTEIFSGPTSIVICEQDMISTAKLLKGFLKEFESFKIKGALLEGKIYNSEEVNKISSLPPRDVLISQFIGLLNNPATRLVSSLSGITRNLASVLDAVRAQKEQAA